MRRWATTNPASHGARLLIASAAIFVTVAVYGQAATPAAREPASAQSTEAEGKDLPEGAGKQILLRGCTTCHGLTEVTKFKGHYVRSQWNDIVVTMAAYGAEISSEEIEVLSDYLTQHLGKKD
jgi:mono/diheme cytochrome c family protein